MDKNTNTTAVESTAAVAPRTNEEIIAAIKRLSAERKAKREATEAAVKKLWDDYVKYREESYAIERKALLKQLDDNHIARLQKREERKREALAKAEVRRAKAEAKIAALTEKPAEPAPEASASADPAAEPDAE